jgi:preprotein translocase subunit YajC
MAFDPLTIGMLAILAVLIFFMFRNGQKRKRDMESLQSQVVPGAEVMTNFGLYGTILAIDEGDNKVQLETSPGNVVTVHRQTIARVITDEVVVPADDSTATVAAPELNADHATYAENPEFGERVDGTERTTNDSRNKKIDE